MENITCSLSEFYHAFNPNQSRLNLECYRILEKVFVPNFPVEDIKKLCLVLDHLKPSWYVNGKEVVNEIKRIFPKNTGATKHLSTDAGKEQITLQPIKELISPLQLTETAAKLNFTLKGNYQWT